MISLFTIECLFAILLLSIVWSVASIVGAENRVLTKEVKN